MSTFEVFKCNFGQKKSPNTLCPTSCADGRPPPQVTSTDKAEEPEPEPNDDSPSTAAAASYDPADYQKPHPDDSRGGGDGKRKKGGATKPRGKAKAKATDKAKDKDKKGKATGRCGNCDAEGAVLRYAQCGTEVYCDVNCQRVSGGRVR